ncbi:MAG: hypothetical protein ACE5HL_03560 [Terriglobia bacterium]
MAKAGKTIPLSSLMRADYSTLASLARYRFTDEDFCILGGSEDWATLINLRGRGNLSKEGRTKLEDFVEDRAREAKTRLKEWLGLKRGRPRDFSKWEVWAVAAALREKDPKKNSWRSLARQLDPKGFADDRQNATDRMRHGIERVLKDRRGKDRRT